MLERYRQIYLLARFARETFMIDAVTFMLGGFLGLGVGIVYIQEMFRQSLEMKADTGIRLECKGRLYTVQSVEIE